MKSTISRLEIVRYEITRWAREPGHAPLASQARECLAQLGLNFTLRQAAKRLGISIN